MSVSEQQLVDYDGKKWHVLIVKLHSGVGLRHVGVVGFRDVTADSEQSLMTDGHRSRPVLFPVVQDRCAQGNVRNCWRQYEGEMGYVSFTFGELHAESQCAWAVVKSYTVGF